MGEAAESAAPGNEDLDARLKELRERYPGTEISYIRWPDGHVEWTMRLRAETPRRLEEKLRDAAADGGWIKPVMLSPTTRTLPEWIARLAKVHRGYTFSTQRVHNGYAVAAVRTSDGQGPLVVITADEGEMRAALRPSLEWR